MATSAQHQLCAGQRVALKPFMPVRICTVSRCVKRSLVCAQHISSNSSTSSTSVAAVQQPHRVAAAPKAQQIAQHSALLSVTALLATAGAAHAAAGAGVELYSIADLDASAAHKLEQFLRPLFTVFTLLYIIRIPMTWYPSIDGTKLPWLLAYAPTEPILKATRNVIPLVGGVDVTPIVWVALISFFNEILLGPQGILMLIQRESGGL